MQVRFQRVLPYTPDQLFEVVADVRRYPDFIPYLTTIRTWDQREEGEGRSSFKAEAQVGYAVFRERFATLVGLDRAAGEVEAHLISGPFHKLENRWKFSPHEQGAAVDFFVEVKLRSKLLQVALEANADRAANKILRGFEHRARQLYGATAAA